MHIRARFALLLLCCGLAFLLPSLAQAAPACTCADQKDMLNRYKEANALIAEYQRQIPRWGNKPFNHAKHKNGVKPGLQTAVNAVTDPTANSVQGETNVAGCGRDANIIKKGKETACILASLDVHEAVHEAACQAWVSREGPYRKGMDYRNAGTMVDYFREDMAAYQAEIEFIKEQLDDPRFDKCPLGWTLEYSVTVFGEGTKSTNQDSSISWSVRHRYAAKMDLLLGVPIPSLVDGKQPTVAELMAGTYPRMWTPNGMLKIPLDVEIDDRIVQYSNDPGEGPAYETTTTTSTWKGNGKDFTQEGGILEIDEKGELYSLRFGVRPQDTAKQVAVLVKEEIDRSAHGYGGAPTHESNTTRNEKLPFSAMEIPNVGAVFNGNRVEHKKRKLELGNDAFEFTDVYAAPKSYMAGLPDVQKSLKVRVHYRLTRIVLK